MNLTVRPGQWAAVTGPSGAGKTTLLSLIAGMRHPSGGAVRWDITTGAVPPGLGGCAWIGQQTVILPGSIDGNIRIGRPDASRDAVEHAVAAAGLADVVARLPRGLDTPLGEGGWGLSAGRPAGSPSPARSCAMPSCGCSMSRPRTSTQTPRRG